MEREYREQPMVEDVVMVTMGQQVIEEYRGAEGGAVKPHCLPVDTMEGIMVDAKMPAGYYCEPKKEETPTEDPEVQE